MMEKSDWFYLVCAIFARPGELVNLFHSSLRILTVQNEVLRVRFYRSKESRGLIWRKWIQIEHINNKEDWSTIFCLCQAFSDLKQQILNERTSSTPIFWTFQMESRV
jgi:hypothetical protein